MQPGDRLICALVEPQTVGDTFTQWPLHVTIVPWFRTDLPTDELAAELGRSLIGSRPFDINVGQEEHFGYKKRKQVNLVDAPELGRLEGQTRRFLHAHKAWVVDEADKTRRGYRPHVTVQDDARLQAGNSFRCERLYVVAQYGAFKRVDAEITL